MLDEFAQLGRMDRLAHALEYARGYGLRLFLIVQNRPQVMDAYGPHAASSIWDNVGCEMIDGTRDEWNFPRRAAVAGARSATGLDSRAPAAACRRHPARRR
jgi:hypothetical protein